MKNQKLSRGGALLAACLLAVSAVTVPVFAEEESETTAAVTESIETTDSAESADSAESSDEADEPDAAEEAADAENAEDAAADPDSEEPETFESGEYSYSLHKNAEDEEDGTIVLETYWGTEPVLELPSELDGKTVSALGESFMTESHSLTEVTLPATVTELGAFTFASCQGLTDYHVAEGNPVFESRDGVLYAGDGTLLMRYPAGRQPTEMEVPEGVTEIGSVAFAGCTQLKSVKLPESLVYIGVAAFTECSSLTEFTVPSGVTEIEAFTFNSCTALKTVNLPETITRIGNAAFAATALDSFEFPASCVSVGQQAFAATNIKEITIPNTVVSLSYAAFGFIVNDAGMLVMDPDFVIYGEYGSEAARYAQEGDEDESFKFVNIGTTMSRATTTTTESGLSSGTKKIIKIAGIIACALLLVVILLIALLSGKKRGAAQDQKSADADDTDTSETAEVTGAAAESAAETEPDAADAAEPDPASTEKEESGDE